MVTSCSFIQKQILSSGPGLHDIDGREYTALGELAVKDQFHISGALELFIDDIVHLGSGIDQGGGKDRKAAAFSHISRRAEESLGRMERCRIKTAGQGSSGRRYDLAGFHELIALCHLCQGIFAQLLTAFLGYITRGIRVSAQKSILSGKCAVVHGLKLFLHVAVHDLKSRGQYDVAASAGAIIVLVDITADHINALCFLGGGEYTISVYGLTVADGWQAYVAGLGATEENAKLFTTNGIYAIGFEQEEQGIDMVIIPVTDTSVLVYAFTPLNGDEEWDEVKGAIVSSIQMAE